MQFDPRWGHHHICPLEQRAIPGAQIRHLFKNESEEKEEEEEIEEEK